MAIFLQFHCEIKLSEQCAKQKKIITLFRNMLRFPRTVWYSDNILNAVNRCLANSKGWKSVKTSFDLWTRRLCQEKNNLDTVYRLVANTPNQCVSWFFSLTWIKNTLIHVLTKTPHGSVSWHFFSLRWMENTPIHVLKYHSLCRHFFRWKSNTRSEWLLGHKFLRIRIYTRRQPRYSLPIKCRLNRPCECLECWHISVA